MSPGYTGLVIEKAVICIISKVKDIWEVILAVLVLPYHLRHYIQVLFYVFNIAFHETRLIQFFPTFLQQLQ